MIQLLNDITTDPSNPVLLRKVVRGSATDVLSEYPKSFGIVQRKRYPNLKPLQMDASASSLFETVSRLMKERFAIVDYDREKKRIQAIAITSLFRFRDDLAVEIRDFESYRQIHMRSRSRIGKSDFGTNAKRIESFFDEIPKSSSMKKRDLEKLGLVGNEVLNEAIRISSCAKSFGVKKGQLKVDLAAIVLDPQSFFDHKLYDQIARLVDRGEVDPNYLFQKIAYETWGSDIDTDAHTQMQNACELPISVAGALMPDAHVGYGLPIGGVLATENAVIPYAVGVDIACRVKLTVYDIPASEIDRRRDPLSRAIEKNTQFGIGGKFQHPKNHPVMESDWSFSKYVESLRDIAWRQLGTSGSGNHFVEFGAFQLLEPRFGVETGEYLALVSHSGSRGSGAKIAGHFSRMARENHPKLPNKLRHLAWLSLDEDDGREYWAAMEMMGEYASANHYLIHRDISKAVGGEILFQVENHHNYAWKEQHEGREVVVHRKGATPAAEGELGFIPGTMIDPGFLVEGTGHEKSLTSCSHGAGRRMSRRAAKQKSTQSGLRSLAKEHGVTLLDAGIDEAPLAYKDINEVMSAQSDLVNVIGRFQPKIVKMAPDGERPED